MYHRITQYEHTVISGETGLDCFIFLFPQWQTDKQVLITKNCTLSILTVLEAHSNITVRSTAGLNLKIAASTQQECRWVLLVIYWKEQNEMKISTTGTASSSAGYRHAFESLNLTHGWNGRAHSLIILGQSLVCFHEAGNLSKPVVHRRSMKSRFCVLIQICDSCRRKVVPHHSVCSGPPDTHTNTHTQCCCPSCFVNCCLLFTRLHCCTESNRKLWKTMKWNVTINQCNCWALIEVEEEDVTDDLVPNVGLLVLSLSQCTATALCDSAFMILICICF